METVATPRQLKLGEPVWELARVFPGQGYWTESDYLNLDRVKNVLIEFTDGRIEVLPTPTWQHQLIVQFLVEALRAFAKPRNLGQAVTAPLPVQLQVNRWREPDVVFVLKENVPTGKYPTRADLVIEIVSEDVRSHERDYVEKRNDYAQAGIPEYWIVDPQRQLITVLTLRGGAYVELGIAAPGASAKSALLPGFEVSVSAVMNSQNSF